VPWYGVSTPDYMQTTAKWASMLQTFRPIKLGVYSVSSSALSPLALIIFWGFHGQGFRVRVLGMKLCTLERAPSHCMAVAAAVE